MTAPTNHIRITHGAQQRQVPAGTTLADLIRQSRLRDDQVAVEVNRRLVRSADYGRELVEGDVVEIVTFVGGG